MTENIKKIGIISSIRTALYFTYANIGLVAKVAAPWLAGYALYTFMFWLLGIGDFIKLTEMVEFTREFPVEARAQGYEKLSILIEKLDAITAQLGPLVQVHDFLDKLIRIVAYGSVAVGLFQEYILKQELPVVSFGYKELKVIGYLILFMAAAGSIGAAMAVFIMSPALGATVNGFFYVVIGLIVLFMSVRFLLVFPAVAVGDGSVSLLRSWRETKGNGFGLFGGMLLVILSSLPVAIFKVTVGKIALAIFVIWPVQLLLSMIILTFILSFLSICYQYFILGGKDETIAPLY